MPRITMLQDNLNERNAEFEQAPLKVPVFLNSVPKCGTHLLRNIMRMFVPVRQQYHAAFIQIPLLKQHKAAFDPKEPKLSWGHLLFSDHSSAALRPVRHVVLVRDPYDWVLARARFFLSENFQADLDHLKQNPRVEDLLNMMIFGIHQKAPDLYDIFTFNAVNWLGTDAYVVRYEDLLKHVKALQTIDAQAYFFNLFAHCGIDPVPDDWRERVRIGADRKQSGTARENLAGAIDLPDELPDMQKRLVDYHAPGLRALLGYA